MWTRSTILIVGLVVEIFVKMIVEMTWRWTKHPVVEDKLGSNNNNRCIIRCQSYCIQFKACTIFWRKNQSFGKFWLGLVWWRFNRCIIIRCQSYCIQFKAQQYKSIRFQEIVIVRWERKEMWNNIWGCLFWERWAVNHWIF